MKLDTKSLKHIRRQKTDGDKKSRRAAKKSARRANKIKMKKTRSLK